MKKTARWTLAAVLSAVTVYGFGSSGRSGSGIEVTYVANEGFLISSGGRKILMDAVFKAETDWCVTPSDATLGRMTGGEAPFDGVSLILITHHHTDHFSAPLTIGVLKANPAARAVLTGQALELLAKEDGFPAVRERVIAPTPRPGAVEKISVKGIDVSVLGMRHSPFREEDGSDRHAGVEHNGYLITMDGMTILHLGDARVAHMSDILDGFRLTDHKIDILFYQCDGQRESIDFIRNQLKPENIVAMHLHPSSFETIAPFLSAYYPEAFFFKELMEKNFFK